VLSPANGGVVGFVPFDAPAEAGVAVIGRQLPSARELAECHGDAELKHLRGVATSLGDHEAAELFAEASKEHRRLEVERSLRRPEDWRRAEAEKRAWYEQAQKDHPGLTQQSGLIGRDTYLALAGRIGSVPAPEPSASAQSAGPSE
jgi:hypothetical protein